MIPPRKNIQNFNAFENLISTDFLNSTDYAAWVLVSQITRLVGKAEIWNDLIFRTLVYLYRKSIYTYVYIELNIHTQTFSLTHTYLYMRVYDYISIDR